MVGSGGGCVVGRGGRRAQAAPARARQWRAAPVPPTPRPHPQTPSPHTHTRQPMHPHPLAPVLDPAAVPLKRGGGIVRKSGHDGRARPAAIGLLQGQGQVPVEAASRFGGQGQGARAGAGFGEGLPRRVVRACATPGTRPRARHAHARRAQPRSHQPNARGTHASRQARPSHAGPPTARPWPSTPVAVLPCTPDPSKPHAQRDPRLHACLQQGVDDAVIERQALLIGGARGFAVREEARPR